MDRMIETAIGMSDGLIVPLAASAGMYAAGMEGPLILQSGLVILAGGTLIMTLGGFLAGRAGIEKDIVAHSNSEHEDPVAAEEKATRRFLQGLDLDEKIQDQAIEGWRQEREEWERFVREEKELAAKPSTHQKPAQMALYVGLSYLLGGLVPLFPYYFLPKEKAFLLSATLSILLLFLLGIQKSVALGLPWWKESGRLLLLGVLATAGAFATGYYFF
jgi:VIT1/CCC1 family predicted Fe2+/Mn2+ transporter